ncbi:hypothetical protein DFP72DRAFT_1072666 [Ephemerocybe angulata]|uniref:Uncharacterized protein n=1 Tax=Ephemerocybe angulata TaxID=980116 RepID=A0A8H6HPG0_9AGAR|nr:hypothetical protein DFP72DRAFT_1072666 [Tulosesus angulatus]
MITPLASKPNIIIFDFFWMQLNSAHSISVLTLVDIDIPYDYEALKRDFSVRNKYKSLSYQRINFKDLPKTFLQPLLYHLGESRQIPEITFKNCRFHGLGVAHANAVDIVVRGIDNWDSMASFLQGVNPVHLHIIACPGFDDESILAMYPWILFRPEEGAPLPRLKSLEFVDCKNFTIGVIQKVIMARNRRDNTHTPWEQTGEYEDVDGLKLVGSCPEPSVKERQWFRKNLNASTILSPFTPFTLKSGSTTPDFAALFEITAVPTPCSSGIVIFLSQLAHFAAGVVSG